MITWDGETIKNIMNNAPSVDPLVQQALDSGENTYIDFTQIQRDTTSTKTGTNFLPYIAIASIAFVGLLLLVRR